MRAVALRRFRRGAITLCAAVPAACTAPNPSIPVGAAAYEVVPPPTPGSPPREYHIGPLDTLAVTVFQEPDLTSDKIVVDASGNILLPLIGSVQASGQTAAQLAQAITDRLRRYLVSPQVSVIVATAVSQKVTVEGSVEQPGVFPIQGRTTLLDALALARGTSRVAALNEVIVFRDIDGRPAAARFDVTQIRKGYQPNPELLGNDIVVVGFSNLKGVYRDLVASSPLIASFTYLIAR